MFLLRVSNGQFGPHALINRKNFGEHPVVPPHAL